MRRVRDRSWLQASDLIQCRVRQGVENSYCARDLSLSASSLCIMVGLTICMNERKNRLQALFQSGSCEPLPQIVQMGRQTGQYPLLA